MTKNLALIGYAILLILFIAAMFVGRPNERTGSYVCPPDGGCTWFKPQ